MRAAAFLVLATLSFSVCLDEEFLSKPELSPGFGNDFEKEYQGFLAPVGNSSADRPQVDAFSPAGALVKRDCAAGQKACSSDSCAPSDATCCSGTKYCPNGGKCCKNSCAVAGGTCCAAGHSCDPGEECCEQKCIPAGTNCCSSNGGSYCVKGNQCVIYDGKGVCCTDLSCTAYVDNNGVTTSRLQTYTYRYTFYWYSYYYTILDLTSTRRTTYTTWYISATDSAYASSRVLVYTSSFKASLTADANTTPRTTPTAKATATSRTARATPTSDLTDGDLDGDLGGATDGPTASGSPTTTQSSVPTLRSGGPDAPPPPGAAPQMREFNMLCLVFGLVISVALMRL